MEYTGILNNKTQSAFFVLCPPLLNLAVPSYFQLTLVPPFFHPLETKPGLALAISSRGGRTAH